MRLIITFLLLLSVNCTAQKTVVFKFDTTGRCIAAPIQYDSLFVLDYRKNKNEIGIQHGMVKKVIVTENDLGLALRDYFSGLTISSKKENNVLCIVLHDFYTEKDADDGIAIFYLHADLYAVNENGYRNLLQIDTLYESRSSYKKLVNDMTGRLFAAVCTSPNPHNTTAHELYTDTVRDGIVYAVKEYKKGVYPTYEAFREMQPADTTFVVVDKYHKDVYEPELYYEREGRRLGKIETANMFAAYDGKRWYKLSEQGAFMMWREGNNFYCRNQLKGIVRSPLVAGSLLAELAVTEDEELAREKGPRDWVYYICRLGNDGVWKPVRRVRVK